ncbi:MAG TPA: YeeE/YedE family protein [Kofleriaceae bacterium]|nr:YeeE/YedE family protein [Kofleriaceae bacterium]
MTRRVSLFVAAVAGVLFGAGLLLSGMTQPARVIGFLDPTGAWDPTLAFVMGGAIAVYAVAHRLILRRSGAPWFELRFHVPERRALDLQLVVGAALFGIGWGLAGMCPGPGIVAAAAGSMDALVFVVAMLVGMHGRHRSKLRWPAV